MKSFEEIILQSNPPLIPLPTGVDAQLNKLIGIKAVVFDIYGTLFISGSGDIGTATATNTVEALTQALVVSGFTGDLEHAGHIGKDMFKTEILEWHRAGHEAGVDYPEIEVSKVWKKIADSLNTTESLNYNKSEIDQIRRLALEYECRVNPVYPMPGSIQLLQRLKENGLTMGIVSNAQFYTPLMLSAFFEKSLDLLGFDPECCIWSYKELKAKPSADLFPKLGKFLKKNHGIELSETLYIGNDMLNDVYCAQVAGCKTALFAGDKRSLRLRENDERCSTLQPDAVITSLNQVTEII